MKHIIYMVLVSLCLFSCSKNPTVSLKITTEIELPKDPSKPEAGCFFPVDTPFKVLFYLKTDSSKTSDGKKIPEDSRIAMRVIDHRNREYHRQSWSIPSNFYDE
ncbi:hypothetical protein K8T06_13355, partial [bacterium]|nr:hypothetical protein [bacterium]